MEQIEHAPYVPHGTWDARLAALARSKAALLPSAQARAPMLPAAAAHALSSLRQRTPSRCLSCSAARPTERAACTAHMFHAEHGTCPSEGLIARSGRLQRDLARRRPLPTPTPPRPSRHDARQLVPTQFNRSSQPGMSALTRPTSQPAHVMLVMRPQYALSPPIAAASTTHTSACGQLARLDEGIALGRAAWDAQLLALLREQLARHTHATPSALIPV